MGLRTPNERPENLLPKARCSPTAHTSSPSRSRAPNCDHRAPTGRKEHGPRRGRHRRRRRRLSSHDRLVKRGNRGSGSRAHVCTRRDRLPGRSFRADGRPRRRLRQRPRVSRPHRGSTRSRLQALKVRPLRSLRRKPPQKRHHCGDEDRPYHASRRSDRSATGDAAAHVDPPDGLASTRSCRLDHRRARPTGRCGSDAWSAARCR